MGIDLDKFMTAERLKAVHLKGRPPATIRIQSAIEQKYEDGWALYLVFTGKNGVAWQVRCNRTSCRALVDAWGRDTDAWAGKRATLQYHKGSTSDYDSIDITPAT